jgi:hypothetical protein
MIKIKILLFTFCGLFCTVLGQAQTTDLALGQWKAHLPFRKGLHVTQSNTDIYFSTEDAVLRLSKDGTEQEKLTKVEGLSTVGVRTITYNKGGGVLVVVYNSGVIDLLSDEGILTVLNIPQSEIILGEKIIYDMFMANDSIAYLATNFGISKMNIHTGKFPSTTKTPLAIESVVIYNNALYAGTAEGIYTGKLDGSINIDDFNNWTFLGDSQGFPIEYSTRSQAVFNDKLYFEANDSVYVYDENMASCVDFREGNKINFLTAEGTSLLIGYENLSTVNSSRVVLLDAANNFTETASLCAQKPQYAIEDEAGGVWIADRFSNYRQWTPGSSSCNYTEIDSPFSNKASEIQVQNGQVWVAAGGIDLSNNSGLGTNDGTFSFIDSEWQEYNKFNVLSQTQGNGFWNDLNTLAIHPENGTVYAGSFDSGIAVFDNEGNYQSFFDKSNSSLQADVNSSNDTRVGGLAFDDENNLWVSNSRADNPISVLRNDGTWKNFTPPCTSDETTRNMAIDAFGYKWFALMNASLGLLVFDEGDLNDDTDDRCMVITTSNSNLPTNEVRDLALDLDGNMWVGTKKGVIVFECNVLDNDCPGSLRIVDEDNFGAFLLEEEDVLSVAVDGANRKWFGTTNGIFVQSPSGEEKIANFTTSSSPLFDNTIQDIAFDNITGEVYIGTNEGLQVYRSDATSGGPTHASNVNVFPNPVRPEYTGQIAISGLAEDADVKITDISGLLVYETTALGGQAVWDGRDYTGRKANTGVYLVFSTSKSVSTPNTAVAKILFIN